jgi:two-component system chemotaxis response regulator CheY
LANVLVVEDDRGVRRLIAATLDDEGHEVRAVENGHEALQACADRMPDLIVLDVEMPVMDGREFVHAIGADGESIPPVVLISAHEAQRTARELGLGRWLQKPFDERRLVSEVSRALGAA